MQKNTILILTLCCLGFMAKAQTTVIKAKSRPVTDSVIIDMCSCIMSKKDTLTTVNLFYAAIDDCIKNAATPKMDSLLKEDGFIQTDSRKARADAVRIVGRKLGQRVANECSGFKAILFDLTENENKKALQ